MKLYYSAGSCSTSCHISLEESGLPYEAIELDWDNASDPNLALVEKLNPMGTLPILVVEPGKVLNQNAAIHTHIADLAPSKGLLPKQGSFERAQALNWLSFVSSDLHKSFSAFFSLPAISSEKPIQSAVRQWALKNVDACFKTLDAHLAGKKYIMGDTFTVVDAYCFVVSNWSKWLQVPMNDYPNVNAYLARVFERPAIQKVYKAEGLLE